MHASMTGMQKAGEVGVLLVGVLLACLVCLAEGTCSSETYNGWLEKHDIHLVNYVAEVGTDVDITSPITPPPIGMRWFSLNYDGELRRPDGREIDSVDPENSEKFMEIYNTYWQRVFIFDELNRWLSIRRVRLGYADLLRVLVAENSTGECKEKTSAEEFDVAITLVTFENHECGFPSKPQNPKKNDTLILSCSVIVNGMWNASLIFRNEFDDTEITGETKTCGGPRKLGSKICSSIALKADADILSYSCRLEFPSTERHTPKNPIFRNSKWTSAFNKEVMCSLPIIYLQAVPSEVTLLCNNMPCGESVAVGDTVTCLSHGYPQPVFDLRIRNLSPEAADKTGIHGGAYANRFFMDNDEKERVYASGGFYTKSATKMAIKEYEDLRIGLKNMGRSDITCNVSNELGWGYSSLVLEVNLRHNVGQLIEPLNYAIVEGSEIRLICSKSVGGAGYWFHSSPLSFNRVLIYHRKIRNDLFSINDSLPGRSDLIFSACKKTSGRYGCDSVYATHTADVIVTEHRPICSWATEGRVIKANCSIGYTGNWPPVIEWSDANGKLDASGTFFVPSQRVTSSLSLPLNGDPFAPHLVTCTVRFRSDDRPKETSAGNIPDLDIENCRLKIEAPGRAVHSGYLQTEYRGKMVLLGDRVELDCFAETSRPLEWHFKHRFDERQAINASSQTDLNAVDAYRIVSEESGHVILIIDHVLLNHAGTYKCKDAERHYKLTVDLTVFRHALAEPSSPLNYASVKGENLRLNCSTENDDSRFWFRSNPLSTEEELIYHNSYLHDRLFSVDESVPGRLDLLFILREGISGRFGCDSGYETRTAEIILSDLQGPSCNSETNGDVVNANCSIGFTGNWSPVILWYNETEQIEMNSSIRIPNERVTNVLTVHLTGDPKELYYLTCSVVFRLEDKPPTTTAQNIPEISPNFCKVSIEATERARAVNQDHWANRARNGGAHIVQSRDLSTDPEYSAGNHVRPVLELFLLVGGAAFTWVELLA